MMDISLAGFIVSNRDELIHRCRTRVAARSAPPPTNAKIDHGVPMFLDQLVEELRHGPSNSDDIHSSAVKHGRELLHQGFSISQVVHGYGDVCQSVSDLALERDAPITTEDFRTLNRCLDDAIAGAVTEYARPQGVSRAEESLELMNLAATAMTGFEALQTGKVAVGGSTAALVYKSLVAIRVIAGRPLDQIVAARPGSR